MDFDKSDDRSYTAIYKMYRAGLG